MNLIPVDIDSIRIDRPLPFHLVDKSGVLLACKSFVVPSRAVLEEFSQRGDGLFIDGVDAEALQRAYLDQLQTMLLEDATLGEIAAAKLRPEHLLTRPAPEAPEADWYDLQIQASLLLRDTQARSFSERLAHLHASIGQQLRRNPDGTLFALVHLSSLDTRMYSATHGMLVSVMCGLASRDVLGWPTPVEDLLRKAALTMNVSMTDLQDQLANQLHPPSEEQRASIHAHANHSEETLLRLGVKDPTWLGAVRDHHSQLPGPLRTKQPTQRLARLIHRADVLAARLAPRQSRSPLAAAAAIQACYFDENKKVDEAGAALIKAVGIYPPGSFVKLANHEVAVVVRRSKNTSTPRVAAVVNRNGLPIAEPALRDTRLPDCRIVGSVSHRQVKVQLDLERLLPLTAETPSDRLG
jgi:hypothetical protein